MPPQLLARLKGIGASFAGISLGQKVIAVLGVAVLALGLTAFGKWVTTPDYVPAWSGLAPEDAQAITDILTADDVKYEVTDGGATIMVPKESVATERMKAASAGVATSTKSGYSILESSGITTSQFMEKVTYQRAMEGELENTIEALDGVRTAVVHLAVPEETVYTDTQGKTTASVLVETAPGATLSDDQIQSILNLTASSVPNLDPTQVTISDSTGRLLSAAGQGMTGSGSGDARTQAYETKTAATIQAMLDKVIGPGKAVASVNAELDFDKTHQVIEEFDYTDGVPPLSQSTQEETYSGSSAGTGDALGTNGVLGVDGTTSGSGTGAAGNGYTKKSDTVNNPVNKTTTDSQVAPGAVKRLSIAVVVDSAAAASFGQPQLQETIAAAAGINDERGDTLSVTEAAFDTSSAEQAAKDLEAAKAEDAAAAQRSLITQGAIGLGVLLAAIFALVTWRRAAKRRATREPLDLGELERLYPAGGPVLTPDGVSALSAAGAPQLSPSAPDPAALRRAEVGELVDAQPAEVADLLRGWLSDTRKA